MEAKVRLIALAISISLFGCDGNETSSSTSAGNENDGVWDTLETGCLANCAREFGECASLAPADYYEGSQVYTDEDSCKQSCETEIDAARPLGKTCSDELTGLLACQNSLNCEELWEYMAGNQNPDTNEFLYCVEYEESDACSPGD